MTDRPKAGPAGPLAGAEAIPRLDFRQFRTFLKDPCRLSQEQQAILAKLTPEKLYRADALLGVEPRRMAQLVAEFSRLPYLRHPQQSDVIAGPLSLSFCRAHSVVSVRAEAGSQAFLLSNPFDLELMDRLARQVGQGNPLSLFITDPETLSALLQGFTDAAGATTEHMSEEDLHAAILSSNPEGEVELSPEDEYEVLSPEQMAQKGKLPPVVRFVNMILSEGVKRGASDIHIEPQEDCLQVRYRIDGILIDATKAPKHFQPMAISRFKIIAKLDIAERRKPQDGRSRLKMGDKRTDLRISVLPTQHGEKVVVRLLAGDSSTVSMDRLGLDPEPLRIFQRMLNSPQGMILVTGPTGSGKTTTLYTALNYVKSPTKNIITLENPVEIQIAGISQVEVNPKGGMTFATGLRSILRQDPDIVLVGEIRDQETATIALEASQTGHLLLSTLHTNDAAATITRLLDLGIEPYQVSSSVIGVVAQRLVRRLCSACAVERTPSPATVEQLGGDSNLPKNVRWLSAAGCDLCEGAGRLDPRRSQAKRHAHHARRWPCESRGRVHNVGGGCAGRSHLRLVTVLALASP